MKLEFDPFTRDPIFKINGVTLHAMVLEYLTTEYWPREEATLFQLIRKPGDEYFSVNEFKFYKDDLEAFIKTQDQRRIAEYRQRQESVKQP